MSLSTLTPGCSPPNVATCALVLEDLPVGFDSKLLFESFPEGGIEESYSVNGYREIAADRMPQPGGAAYRGGNWSAFSLELKFRAGNALGGVASIETLSTTDLESILTQMERRARWCQALTFPGLERSATSFIERIEANAREAGIDEATLKSANLGQLSRRDPPMVLVVFGSWMTLRCYATGYSMRWEHPFHPVTVQPYGCTVTLSLQRLDKGYPTWKSIRNQAGGLPQSPTVTGSSLIRAALVDVAGASMQAQNGLAFAAAAAAGGVASSISAGRQ